MRIFSTLQQQNLTRPTVFRGTRVTLKSQKPGITHLPKIKAFAPASTDSIDDETEIVLSNLLNTFKSADTNSDGVLDRYELRDVLEKALLGTESVPLKWLTDDDLDQIMEQYDENNDGFISFEEFKVLAQDKVFLSAALSEYKAAFSAIDSNNNGRIGPTELLSLFRNLGSPLQEYERIVQLMQRYDVNQDGEIDFGEFLRLCRYEQALPLDDILNYAKINASKSSSSSSLSIDSPDKGTVTMFSSEADFVSVIESNPDKLIVLLASLTWCRPCKKVLPAFNKCAAAYADNHTVFLRFNGNENEDTKNFFKTKLKVRVTPSFFFFEGKELLGSCTGANAPKFEDNLRANIEKAGLVGDTGLPDRLYEPFVEQAAAASSSSS